VKHALIFLRLTNAQRLRINSVPPGMDDRAVPGSR
jgi:hypothetical protein